MKSSKQQSLKKQAHSLKPTVIVGNKGLTQAVQLEIERALIAHELIKIRVSCGDRSQKQLIIDKICQEHESELINAIGNSAVFYRKNDDKV